MRSPPKTIQIFLPGGDPQGIRVAEITTRIVQVIEVPRSLLNDFFAMTESTQVAVYFLFGEAEDGEQQVYIGQTGDLKARLKQHNRDKDFWDRALVVVSKTNSLTQTHALFLEWHCLTKCRDAGRYSGDNGNCGIKPYTPPPLEADCLEFHETADTLLATLGFPVFEPLARVSSTEEQDVFYCTRSGADGRCLYKSEGVVVLAGSSGRAETVASIGENYRRQRDLLVEQGVARIEGDRFVFARDHLFRSPSGSACVLMGRPSNGWVDWKRPDGRTMDEIKRQSSDE